MKVDSDVLLLSYFDKICLALTGELQRALACLYSRGGLGAIQQPSEPKKWEAPAIFWRYQTVS